MLPKSEGALDKVSAYRPSSSYHAPPAQTQSQIELVSSTARSSEDRDDSDQRCSSPEEHYTYPTLQYRSETVLPKRQIWQRSASCRDLYDFSFEDSGQAKRHPKPVIKPTVEKNTYISLEERKLESPITRYDEANRALYSISSSRNVSLDIHQDIIIPGQKVYSSSYPGTTHLSQESMEDPGNYELAESQDDLSHDSYELLERSDDDYSTSGDYRHRKTKSMNTRSCSLDSGNYLPTDSESDSEKHHKCKSSSDVHQDIFLMDDPRDLPREKIPRKSDGSFYKTLKIGSRTSSLESKSDYYDSKMSKSSRDNLRKSGWDQSFGSRTSSQESKSDYEIKKMIGTRKNKSFESLGMKQPEYVESRTSSLDSKSDYYDANSKIIDDPKYITSKYHHEYDRKIQFERNYGTQKSSSKSSVNYDSFPSFKETSHVHSISLQNVETEQNIRANRMLSHLEQQNTIPRTHKSANYARRENNTYDGIRRRSQTTTHIWPEDIAGVPTEIQDWTTKSRLQRSTESESNIFSFDEDKIQSLQESDIELGMCVDHSAYSIVSAMNQGENDLKSKTQSRNNNFREGFMEIEPKRLGDGNLALHQPIERTKSDPNSIGNRQRMGSNTRRHMLMHQKSIDLTPAESSDEDYLFKQIPSAPPITKYRGTHFEMPTAEFGHFDILKREAVEGQKTKFEVPKSQFEILGAKTQSDLVNLPPKNDFDIPYVLHKRHMMNGTAAKVEEIVKYMESEKVVVDSPVDKKRPKPPPEPVITDSSDECKSSLKTLPPETESTGSFLFTQNIDLSKIDPITLEVDKSEAPVQHMASPKRDITKIDPIMLEALSSKLSQIESDSPTSSKTESIKPEMKLRIQQIAEAGHKIQEEPKTATEIIQKQITDKVDMKTKQTLKEKIKTELKPKRIIKPRMQPNKKGGKNKTKVRITSFSSDDESLDSDDVFGSTEATPTRLEFSPPQSRKEMEPILKYESERQTHLQYTMSSTEIEGSPPTTRKQDYIPYDRSLDPNYQTELRRISERSISIPSSEEDVNFKATDVNQPVFEEPEDEKTLTLITEQAVEECPTITEDSRDTKLTSDTISEDLTRIEVKPLPLQDQTKLSPTKPTIPEKESPSVQRKRGQSPLLFAHARLNLSEGSAFAVIQRQTATTSPTAGRRAKSLDAPIISVNKLPALNAFSSKDDTVEEMPEIEPPHAIEAVKSEPAVPDTKPGTDQSNKKQSPTKESSQKIVLKKSDTEKKDDKIEKSKSKKPDLPDKRDLKGKKPEEKDQIVPDVTQRSKKTLTRSGSMQKSSLSSQKSLPTDNNAKAKSVQNQRSLPTQKTHSRDAKTNNIARDKLPLPKSLPPKPPPRTKSSEKPSISTTKPKKDRLPSQRSLPISKPEKETSKSLPSQMSLPVQQSLQTPEIKRTKSQEIESAKRTPPKEKSRSFEKLEFKRTNSKERAKSQEDSDSDVAKRIEKQQMLYETAIKQTLKSPVKDVLPVFPTVEETVRVNDGKLEISIDTIETSNIPLEEAIIITKSPKRLDKKLTKSLELNLTGDQSDSNIDENGKTVMRLGKSLDLDTRSEDEKENLEFDFKPESIKAMEDPVEESDIPQMISETSPESDGHVVEQIIEAEVHKEPPEIKESIVLEGTSLDIWLSVDAAATTEMPKEKLEKIAVIKKSDENTFFEGGSTTKPPDLIKDSIKHDTKSSSESHSLEKTSLGNSLDIKYIDDSGDSSHKSEKDAKLIKELQKSIAIDNALSKKIEKIIRDGDSQKETKKGETPDQDADELDNTLVRITSEDESLTEVSDLKFEAVDSHLLGFEENRNKGTLLKLSIERSRSEDTTSWVTVECDEYVGADSFDVEEAAPLESPEKITSTDTELAEMKQTEIAKEKVEIKTEEVQKALRPTLLTTEPRSNKTALLKHTSDHSRSSDTTGSWTSGEKDLSPGNNVRETGDESSVSCSIAKTIGLSQHIEKFESLDQLHDDSEPELIEQEKPIAHKLHILERSSPIDEESSSASNGFPKPKESKGSKSDDSLEVSNVAKNKYPFEQKWASDSELSQKIHQKISKKLSSADKNSISSLDDSVSDKRWNAKGSLESKPTLTSIDKLSIESRNSIDTESSSGSLGVAHRMQKSGEVPPREPSSTWRPFLIESSGSSSLEEGLLPPDHDLESQDYFLSRQVTGEYSGHYELVTGKPEGESGQSEDHYDFQDELSEFPANFGYPCLTSAMTGIGLGGTDVLGPYGQGFLARTLSRISERSTNSENTSLEDDSTKASTQSDSVNDESLMSSDHQASLSSDSPSNAHICVGEAVDKKSSNGSSGKRHKDSSGNNKHSIEQNIVNVNNLLLNRQMSDDRRTSAEMADLSIDDIEIITSERGLKLKRQDSDDTIIDEEEDPNPLKPSSSQESEDWPLPDIPIQIERHSRDRLKQLEFLHEMPSMDSIDQHAKLMQITPPHIPKTFGQRGSLKSQDSEQWPSPPSSLLETPVVGNVESYYMQPEEACKVTVDSTTDPTYENESNADSSEENKTLENDDYCEVHDSVDQQESKDSSEPLYDTPDQYTQEVSSSISESVSGIQSGVKIVLETKSAETHSSNSEEDMNNDDVFTDVLVDPKNELRPPTVLRRSTTSDDSSHSGAKNELKPPSPKQSHSSYSEEECTSSMGTNFEEGTVRFALRPAKCTHSSHSEDTSVALSLSEWSNSTNTVKLQNLSASNNSGATKSSTNTSGALRSDDNSITELAQSISEWSSSNSNTLLAHQSSSLQFQKLSNNTSTGDSTLTEMVPTISEWTSSDTIVNTVPTSCSINTINIEGCLEQLLDDDESVSAPSVPAPKSPENIPSEDLASIHLKQIQEEPKQYYTKSTERPVTIPLHHIMSDTEKSTDGSSVERQLPQEDIDRRPRHCSKSTERPVKVPLKYSKCTPYYSSSLSSESTSAAVSKPITIIKNSTIPLMRTHRKSLSKSLLQSPPSENDSTSSVESPIGTPETRCRGPRRRRQLQPKRHKHDREARSVKDEFMAQSPPVEFTEPEKFMCGKDFSDLPSDYEYKSDIIRRIYSENVEEGYFPDGDSQSGSDIFRIENEGDFEENLGRFENLALDESFDVSSIPPPLLEDDFGLPDRDPEI